MQVEMQMEILIYVPSVADLSHMNRGSTQHLRSCYLKNNITDVQTPYERNEHEANHQTCDDLNIEILDISTPSLQYKCGNYQDYLFQRNLSLTYKKRKEIYIFITI